jgi:surface antigen
MGPYLARRGFHQISNPQPGAIVIMQSTFPGAGGVAGHVGIVERVDNGKLTVRGANQGLKNRFKLKLTAIT